jgi:hypothetical protein
VIGPQHSGGWPASDEYPGDGSQVGWCKGAPLGASRFIGGLDLCRLDRSRRNERGGRGNGRQGITNGPLLSLCGPFVKHAGRPASSRAKACAAQAPAAGRIATTKHPQQQARLMVAQSAEPSLSLRLSGSKTAARSPASVTLSDSVGPPGAPPPLSNNERPTDLHNGSA